MNVFKRIISISALLFLCSCYYYEDITSSSLEPGAVTVTKIESSARGSVNMEIYLPPGWDKTIPEGYPLIIYLHGQWGDEHSFFFNVNYRMLNSWIHQEEIPPFILVSIDAAAETGDDRQWTIPANETFLTSDDENELRMFCKTHLNANINPGMVSIHGQSMGARGALHYGFKFPDRFASAISNAFVSDYALEEEQLNALANRDRIVSSGIKLRLVIGTLDQYYLNLFRKATYTMHEYLDVIDIPHEFEVLPGATHYLYSLWNSINALGIKNGLYELKLHASAWSLNSSKEYDLWSSGESMEN